MRRALESETELNSLQIFLTDKFPNQVTVEKVASEADPHISYLPQPVDALKVPVDLAGFRTIFSSFHHFNTKQASLILQNAVDDGEGIAIFEVARPRILTMALTTLMFVAGFASALFMRPIRLARLFWTCVVPVVPLVLFLDGVVSCLRAYTPKQLWEMVSSLRSREYTWEVGEDSSGLVTVTYLIGYPSLASRKQRTGGDLMATTFNVSKALSDAILHPSN